MVFGVSPMVNQTRSDSVNVAKLRSLLLYLLSTPLQKILHSTQGPERHIHHTCTTVVDDLSTATVLGCKHEGPHGAFGGVCQELYSITSERPWSSLETVS